MRQIEDISQHKKTSDLERLIICKLDMVRVLDSRWNHFEADLRLLQSKLEKFGIILINNEAAYLENGDNSRV